MNTKNIAILDLGLIKWSSIFFTLFLVSVWPGFASWIASIPWAWFLVISLLLAVRPALQVLRN